MADHVVVPTEACRQAPDPTVPACGWFATRTKDQRCRGCLGDGTRAVLDQAVAVRPLPPAPDNIFPSKAWREVES